MTENKWMESTDIVLMKPMQDVVVNFWQWLSGVSSEELSIVLQEHKWKMQYM